MPPAEHDPDLLGRLLGTAPTPADAAARAAAGTMARLVQQVALPPGRLTGWSSLCAEEYAEALEGVRRAIALAAAALGVAARGGG